MLMVKVAAKTALHDPTPTYKDPPPVSCANQVVLVPPPRYNNAANVRQEHTNRLLDLRRVWIVRMVVMDRIRG